MSTAANTPIKATLVVEYADKNITATLHPEAAERLLCSMRNKSNGKPYVPFKEILQSETEAFTQ